MPNPLCIYHGRCIDGFTSAWVIHRALGGAVDLYEGHHGDAPPDVTGRDVIIVDFSYPRASLVAMEQEAASLLVLDHHKTALAALDGLPFCVFDMERSGAGLAWDQFMDSGQRHTMPPEPPPKTLRHWLVDYVEDRDLWRFALPDSKAVNALVSAWPMTLDEWTRLSALPLADAVKMGEVALMKVDRYVSDVARLAYRATLDGLGECTVVNAHFHHCSELVGHLAENDPGGVAVGWWRKETGEYQFSLRSRGDVDVSAVAVVFGGGGHRNAAGFVLPELPDSFR